MFGLLVREHEVDVMAWYEKRGYVRAPLKHQAMSKDLELL